MFLRSYLVILLGQLRLSRQIKCVTRTRRNNRRRVAFDSFLEREKAFGNVARNRERGNCASLILAVNLAIQATHKHAPIVNVLQIAKCAFEDTAAMQ